MGEVYKARDTRLDRTVAIKVLPAALALDPQFRDRFDREAKAISALDHPHICALYDVGEQDGTSFLVMQYLEGETLADRLSRVAGSRGPGLLQEVGRVLSDPPGLPIDQALTIAIQIASALDKPEEGDEACARPGDRNPLPEHGIERPRQEDATPRTA